MIDILNFSPTAEWHPNHQKDNIFGGYGGRGGTDHYCIK